MPVDDLNGFNYCAQGYSPQIRACVRRQASSDTHPHNHPHNLACAWHGLGNHRGTYNIMYSLVNWEPYLMQKMSLLNQCDIILG